MTPTISDQQNVVLWAIVSFAVCIPVLLFCMGVLGSMHRGHTSAGE